MKTLVALALALLMLPSCGTVANEKDPTVPDEHVVEQGTFQADTEDLADNAQAYYQSGDYYRALDQFRKHAKLSPGVWSAELGQALCLYGIGHNLATAGRYREARKQLDEAASILNGSWDGTYESRTDAEGAHKWRFALALGLTERALGNIDSVRIDAINKAVHSADAKRAAELMKEQDGLRRDRKTRYDNALERFTRLSRMENPAPDAVLNRGDLEYLALDTEGAVRSYERYLDVVRGSIENWIEVRRNAVRDYETKRKIQAAQQIIDGKLTSAKQKASRVLVQLAEIYFDAAAEIPVSSEGGESKQGFERARSLVEEAYGYTPGRVELLVPIAECDERLGDSTKALGHLDEFMRRNPGYDTYTQRAFRLRRRIRTAAEGK